MSQGEPPALAIKRLDEARELDPRWPWALGALAKAQLAAGDLALAAVSAEQALALHRAEGQDKRVATRWETPWLRANLVEALTRAERYDEAGKRLDVLLADEVYLPALGRLRSVGVFELLEEKLGRTFKLSAPLPPGARQR